MQTKIRIQNQIDLPEEYSKMLNLEVGNQLELIPQEDRLIVVPEPQVDLIDNTLVELMSYNIERIKKVIVSMNEGQKHTYTEKLLRMVKEHKSLRTRIRAAIGLGHLGDPRIGQMVEIPAGYFHMGTTPEKMRELKTKIVPEPGAGWLDIMNNEITEQNQFYVEAFKIDKYPITWSQYMKFVDQGYEDGGFWSEEGLKWKDEHKVTKKYPAWHIDDRYNQPNQPIVGVNWYEAEAYCNWRSEEEGGKFRLPTEAEWEKASRGTEGRMYSWGEDWDDFKCNSYEIRAVTGWTTPIGVFPDNISPFGVMDTLGNIWEWTLENYKPYVDNNYIHDTFKPEHKIIRGGGWQTERIQVHCARRLPFPITTELGKLGIRCVQVGYLNHP